MLDLAADLLPVLGAGESVAVVTVARVARSAPRGAGAAMAVLRDGRVIGSISGGCVEGDAVLLASAVLASGGVRRASLGFDDDTAHAAGLACGGSIDVVVHRIDPDDDVARRALADAAADRPARAGVVLGGPHAGRVVDGGVVAEGPTRVEPAAWAGADVLVVVHEPRPRLIVIGAGEHAMALARVAASAGFGVDVCDVWDRLVTRERFPDAERLVVGVPAQQLPGLVGAGGRRTAVCVLTHDERVDVPALAEALTLDVGFVGAMGARSTVAHRRELLAAHGVAPADLDRLHSPLGLDLGGAAPEEAALAVLGEIVAARHGGTGRPLRDLDGPLHLSRDAEDRRARGHSAADDPRLDREPVSRAEASAAVPACGLTEARA